MEEKLAILFVGDERSAQRVRVLIKQTPYKGSRLYQANNLAEACLTRGYDLIITTFSNGIELFSSLRQAFPSTAIVYYGNNEALADQAVFLGVQDFLPEKDIDPISLARIISFSIEREEYTSKLREKTFTDDLTGLYNRRGFVALLKQHMNLTKRANQGFTLFLFDLDAFKQINDRHGHPAGDEALVHTAQALIHAFRAHDIVARLGGDEFAVIALNTQPSSEEIFKRRLSQHLEELNAGGLPYKISCSIGSIYYDGNGLSIQQLIAEADKDLYKAKSKHHDLLKGRDERI